MYRLALFSALALAVLSASAQQERKPRTFSFHVTNVMIQEDPEGYCTTGTCSAKRFTVEGDSAKPPVHFVLTCVQISGVGPSPAKIDMNCPRVHAGFDYVVTLYGDSVAFLEYEKCDTCRENALVPNYDIVSEAEAEETKSKMSKLPDLRHNP